MTTVTIKYKNGESAALIVEEVKKIDTTHSEFVYLTMNNGDFFQLNYEQVSEMERQLGDKQMTKYTLYTDQIGDGNIEDFQARFVFEANGQFDATRKAEGWASYQGFSITEVMIEPTKGQQLEWNTHNEYVSQW